MHIVSFFNRKIPRGFQPFCRKYHNKLQSLLLAKLKWLGHYSFLLHTKSQFYYFLPYWSESIPFNQNIPLLVEGANSSYFKTRIELYPGLKTFIGTEVGVLDYLVSARTYLHWNLYKGFDLGVLYDYPFMWSDDLNREHGWYRQYHQPSKILSILLHRRDVFGNFVNIISGGVHGKNWVGCKLS